MMLKLFLPLIAAMKAGARGSDVWSLGVQVAQAYKGCKAELNCSIDRAQGDADRQEAGEPSLDPHARFAQQPVPAFDRPAQKAHSWEV